MSNGQKDPYWDINAIEETKRKSQYSEIHCKFQCWTYDCYHPMCLRVHHPCLCTKECCDEHKDEPEYRSKIVITDEGLTYDGYTAEDYERMFEEAKKKKESELLEQVEAAQKCNKVLEYFAIQKLLK